MKELSLKEMFYLGRGTGRKSLSPKLLNDFSINKEEY